MYLYLNIHPLGERLLQAFSWMLVHSIWQGMLLSLVAVILLRMAGKAAAAKRYNIVFAHLIVFAGTCMMTFLRELTGAASQTMLPLAGPKGLGTSTLFKLDAIDIHAYAISCVAFISANAHLLVILWGVFFSFRSLSMVQGLIYLRHARQRQVYAVSPEWRQRLQQLCDKLGITRTVSLLESTAVKVPIVAGHLKPVILMPAGLLTGLPPAQIEAVLLHELAHIRRHDYIVNVLQTCCETIFFFNPGLLWLSALLRDEREHCCDDIALQQTGSKKTFIQALISFKEYTLSDTYTAVAFPGRKNQLLQRVSRIIENRQQPLGTAEKSFFLIGIALLCIVLSAAAITQFGSKTAEQAALIPAVVSVPAVITPAPATIAQKGKPAAKRRIAAGKQPINQAIQTTVATASEDVADIPTADNAAQTSDAEIEEARQHQEQLTQDRAQAERDRHQAALNRLQAESDKKQADKDRAYANQLRIQADRDREQAVLHRIQADKDRQQAEIDRLQAMNDRAQAEQDRIAHERVVAAEKVKAAGPAFYNHHYTGSYKGDNRYKGADLRQ